MRVGAPRPEALHVPGAVNTGGHNLPPHRWWTLAMSPLQEQCVLRTAEPSLQSHREHLKIRGEAVGSSSQEGACSIPAWGEGFLWKS